MSSSKNSDGTDSRYQRVFRLWISLWDLVLGSNRDLDKVCQTLQDLVFSATEWPGYKNWREISKIGETNKLVMLALCQVKTPPTDELSRRLVACFPECFTKQPVRVFIPLSFLQTWACQRKKNYEDFGDPRRHLYLTGTLKEFALPHIIIAPIDSDDANKGGVDFALTHDELESMGLPVTDFGYEGDYFNRTVEFQCGKYLVVDTWGWHHACLVPAEIVSAC